VSRALLTVIALAGCVEASPERPQPLARTTEWWREPSGPGSYEQCLASPQSYFGCDIRIRLCDNGAMHAISGDVLWRLAYTVQDGVAVGVDTEGGEQLHFDLEALTSPELGTGWMLATDGGMLGCEKP
jgi:hypothetical protein